MPAVEANSTIIRHEFSAASVLDTFVVFQSMEGAPFWRRDDNGIRFVFCDLTYDICAAIAEKRNSLLRHAQFDTTVEEFREYFREALGKCG